MHFEKSNCELYRIANDGEWATIALKVFPERDDRGQKIYGGELLVHSSFGNFAHGWSTCSSPFKKFLADLDYSYLMGKLMGTDAKVYDQDKTYQTVLKRLDEMVTFGTYSEGDRDLCVTALEDEVNGYNGTEVEFLNAMNGLEVDGLKGDICYLTDDSHQYIETKPNPQATGFWNEIWPTFAEALRQETAVQAA